MPIKKTFIIGSVETRIDDLNGLLDSIVARHDLDDFDICITFQDKVGGGWERVKHKNRITKVLKLDEWVGIHNARIKLLREIADDYDVFINLDDDMRIGDKTDYRRCVELCQRPDVGFVMTAWVRYEKALEKATPNDKLRKQICLYQGGGMAYDRKIAKLVVDFGECKTGHDMWSLLAYVKGYDNYYDYSSYTLHRVCQTGGLSLWHRAIGDKDLMLSQYVNVRKAKNPKGNGNDILIPLDSDINAMAKMEHKMNRDIKGWE